MQGVEPCPLYIFYSILSVGNALVGVLGNIERRASIYSSRGPLLQWKFEYLSTTIGYHHKALSTVGLERV
jgi:hypothetical protein